MRDVDVGVRLDVAGTRAKERRVARSKAVDDVSDVLPAFGGDRVADRPQLRECCRVAPFAVAAAARGQTFENTRGDVARHQRGQVIGMAIERSSKPPIA